MEYLYREFDFKKYRVRCVRMLNIPARITSSEHRHSEAGLQLSSQAPLSAAQIDALKGLREHLKTQDCYVYFDIKDGRLKNLGKQLSFFAEGASLDATDDWEFKIGYLN